MKKDNIIITPLPKIQVIGGDVWHAIKMSDIGYSGFGEAYLSWVANGAVKAWKRHIRMTMNILVPVGEVRFVFRVIGSDGTEEFKVEEIGVNNYARITVPPGVWFGFKGLDTRDSLVINIANIPHDPDEVERLHLKDLDYQWI